jgi:ferric-dicitrate binding protein FerR (iron transport regulator)
METMEAHDNIPDFLVAFLQKEATEEQVLQAKQWLNDPENLLVYHQLEKIWLLSADQSLLKNFDPQKGRQKVWNRFRKNRIKGLFIWCQRVAALLFVPVLAGCILFYHQRNELTRDVTRLIVMQEIITQPGTKSHLFLPDSTEVWLNSSSTLRFPSQFAGKERKIELEGEAYFRVFKNKNKPFVVNTQYQNVEAVGTAFNLSAYHGDVKISTTLVEGKVKIECNDGMNDVRFLNPGTQLNYNTKSNSYNEMKVRVQDVIAWKDGVLIFCETPFHEVALKLGRWFNADIQIADPSVANYRFTGTFTSESLDQVLELLTISTPIDYSSSQRTILKNRSFSKQEIKIWKNSGAKK